MKLSYLSDIIPHFEDASQCVRLPLGVEVTPVDLLTVFWKDKMTEKIKEHVETYLTNVKVTNTDEIHSYFLSSGRKGEREDKHLNQKLLVT